MRHCHNEKPEVYETHGPDLTAVLREVADFVETVDESVTVNIHPYIDDEGSFIHLATVYVS